MSKRGCLGCGKIYEGTISICQECFNKVESVRSQFDFFPRGLRKKPILMGRKFLFWFLPFYIISIVLVLIFCPFSLKTKELASSITEKFGASIWCTYFSLNIILSLFGLYLGRLINMFSQERLFKIWSNKEWYSASSSNWLYIKFGLPTSSGCLIVLLYNVIRFLISRVILTVSAELSVHLKEGIFYIS